MSGFERADIGDHLLGEIFLVLALLDVGALEALHVALVEDRRPRADPLHFRADLLEQRRLEDAGGPGGAVTVFLEDVPAAEHQIVERGERDDLGDLRGSSFGPLAQTDGAHLRQRTDRFGQALSNSEHAGDRRRADGTHPDQQHTELAARRSDLNW